jgi:LysM repeat protein
MQKWMIAGIGVMLLATVTNAQNASYKERAQAYIDKHKMIAMAEQQRTGIPAAITLAQGVLETDAGNSELAVEANNHFGIKCKSTWTGETFAHTDDAPNECFRKYKSTHESYKDHSDFLKQPRYNPLFRIPVTNYEEWAKGLKKFGYATNPRYAQQLIKIIEDYNLQDYTFAANNKDIIYPTEFPETNPKTGTGIASKPNNTAKPVANNNKINTGKPVTATVVATPAAPAMKTVTEVVKEEEKVATNNGIPAGVEPGKIVRVNGLRAIYALKGDVLLTYAIKQNIRYERLLELNELPDAPLKENMYIFLDKKKTRGMKATRTVGNGETLMQIAQSEGMQIQALRELNMLRDGEEPAPGAVLNLQRIVDEKPSVIGSPSSKPVRVADNHRNNTTVNSTASAPTTNKPELLDKKTLEKNKAEDQKMTAAAREEQRKQQEAERIAANKARAEEARLAREKAAEDARLERERKAEEQKIIVKTRAEKLAADEQAKKQAITDAENKKKADELAAKQAIIDAENKKKADALAEARAIQEQKDAAAKAEAEKQAALTAKEAEEKALQEQIAAEAKAADELRIANMKAAEERRQAEAREREEKKALAAKEAEERRIAEEKAEEERLAAAKAEEERKVAEAVAAEEKRIAEEKAEAERKLAEAKAQEEKRIAEAKERQKNRTVVNNNEPQDEFSRLKNQLDKVVYATDERETEKVKEAEAKRIAELQSQEEKARALDAKRVADAKAAAEKKAAEEKAISDKKALEAKLAADKKKAAEAKAAENSKFYVVKPGDTLASIAKKNKLTMRQLMEWNNMEWAEVTPGQKLVVKQ